MADNPVTCPSCGREYRVRTDQLGKTAKCKCGERFELIASLAAEDIVEASGEQDVSGTQSVSDIPKTTRTSSEEPWTPLRVSSRLRELGIPDETIPPGFVELLARCLRPGQPVVDCAFGYLGHELHKSKLDLGYTAAALIVHQETASLLSQGNVQKWLGKLILGEAKGGSRTEFILEEGLGVTHDGPVLSIRAEDGIYRVNLLDQEVARRIVLAIRNQLKFQDKSAVAAQLEKLVEMKLKGQITDQEFGQAKKRLLGG